MTTVNSILKEVYEKQIRDQLYNEAIGLKRIERSSEGVTSEVGGKYVTFPIRTRRNAGIGGRNELEALPIAGQQGYAAARVSLKYLYGLTRLSGQTFELADKDFQAFSSAMQMEMDGLKSDLVKDQNRQFYGTNNGKLAVAAAGGTGVNIMTVVSTKYLEVGQFIDIIDVTTIGNATPTPKASARTITAINQTTKVITFDGATTTFLINDYVVRNGSANREITGLQAIVTATGSLYNVDPTVEPTWAATVDANGGTNRPLSEGLMILQADRVRAFGGSTSVIFCGLGVRRAYFNLLTQQRRFSDTKEFAGGFSGLTFTTDKGDIPVVVDVDAQDNTMYFLDEKQITLYRDKEWSFLDRDGSSWQRVIGYDAYEATMYQYMEIGTHKRNAQAVMQDLTEG